MKATRRGFLTRLFGGAAAVVAAPAARALAPAVDAEATVFTVGRLYPIAATVSGGSGVVSSSVYAAPAIGARGWAYVYESGATSLVRNGDALTDLGWQRLASTAGPEVASVREFVFGAEGRWLHVADRLLGGAVRVPADGITRTAYFGTAR